MGEYLEIWGSGVFSPSTTAIPALFAPEISCFAKFMPLCATQPRGKGNSLTPGLRSTQGRARMGEGVNSVKNHFESVKDCDPKLKSGDRKQETGVRLFRKSFRIGKRL